MPTPAPHSFCRILRTDENSIDIAADHPEAGAVLQLLASTKCPVSVERTTANSYRIRELTGDALLACRGRLVEDITRAYRKRGQR